MNMPYEIYAGKFNDASCGKRLVSGEGIWQSEEPHSIYDSVKYVKEPKWRPIETAPKDGSDVLLGELYADGSMIMAVGMWWANCWGALGNQALILQNGSPLFMIPLEINPTHWMPLPDAPEVVG